MKSPEQFTLSDYNYVRKGLTAYLRRVMPTRSLLEWQEAKDPAVLRLFVYSLYNYINRTPKVRRRDLSDYEKQLVFDIHTYAGTTYEIELATELLRSLSYKYND